MLHEPDCRGMVFVRGYGYFDAVAADSGEKFRYAIERPGHVGAVLAVVGQEKAAAGREGLVGCRRYVGDGVEQGPVQVENH